MQAFSKDNNGISYLPTVIDIFSKFVWSIPLKRKTGQEIENAFSRILKERRPSKSRYLTVPRISVSRSVGVVYPLSFRVMVSRCHGFSVSRFCGCLGSRCRGIPGISVSQSLGVVVSQRSGCLESRCRGPSDPLSLGLPVVR